MQNDLPTLDQLAEFFGNEPCDVVEDDGVSIFRVSESNIDLTVSIGEINRSFQTVLHFADVPLSTVVFEGLDELLVIGDKTGPFLRASFAIGDAEIKCVIRVRPNIQVEWSGIAS